MLDRLEQMAQRYEDLGAQLADPSVTNDQGKYQKIAKQHSELSEAVEKYREYQDVQRGIATVVVGGLAIATALTLFVLPSMYHVIEHWAEERRGSARWGS